MAADPNRRSGRRPPKPKNGASAQPPGCAESDNTELEGIEDAMSWLIVDGHEDIAMALLEEADRDFGAPAPAGQALSLADAKRGGLGMILSTLR